MQPASLIKGDEKIVHIFVKVREERVIQLSIYFYYIAFLTFLILVGYKLARLHSILQLKIFITSVTFSYIFFGFVIADSQVPKFTTFDIRCATALSPRWLQYHPSEASCLLHHARRRAHSIAEISVRRLAIIITQIHRSRSRLKDAPVE